MRSRPLAARTPAWRTRRFVPDIADLCDYHGAIVVVARIVVPLVLPLAWAWVALQEQRICRHGVKLSTDQIDDARRAGVMHPERVRLLKIDEIPAGMPAALRAIGRRLGLVSPGTIGMSLRYGILIRADAWGDRRILVHELAHTAQYERLGGLRNFLRCYLCECFTLGYCDAPLESEACSISCAICT